MRWSELVSLALLFSALIACDKLKPSPSSEEPAAETSAEATEKKAAPPLKLRARRGSGVKPGRGGSMNVAFLDKGAALTLGQPYNNVSPRSTPLKISIQTAPNAKVEFAGKKVTASQDGFATITVEPEWLFKNAKLVHADKDLIRIGVTRGADHFVVQFPAKVSLGDQTLEKTGTIFLNRALVGLWGAVTVGAARTLPGDPDPDGKPKGAMVTIGGRWNAFGQIESVYDVDLVVKSMENPGKSRKCGPYGDQRKFIRLDLGAVKVEAWKVATGKSLGSRRLQASAACPRKIWSSTTSTAKGVATYDAVRNPAVVRWLETLLRK